jgi:hypothetical protein
MKLFTELQEEVSIITEAKESGGKDYFIEGIFLQADIKNRNGRIYPMPVMEKEVERYIKEKVETNRATGELGHPEGPAINLDRVSHIITELKRDGNNYIGKAKITNTPKGDIARGLLESGVSLGVSSRAMGSLKESNGVMIVQEDLRIATAADIVADPSAPDAFVKGIMENVEWIYDEKNGWKAVEFVEETRKDLLNNYKKLDESKMLQIFESFLSKLS